jgi:hypothetical protein
MLELRDYQISAYNFLLEKYHYLLMNKINLSHLKNMSTDIKNVIFDRSIGLTGTAGCGKSTVLLNFCLFIQKNNLNFLIVTPTQVSFEAFISNIDSIIKNDQVSNDQTQLFDNIKLKLQLLTKFLNRTDFNGIRLNLLPTNNYLNNLQNNLSKNLAILDYDIIIFDDASLLNISDINDLETRITADLNNLNESRFPIFVFIGDSNQLLPKNSRLNMKVGYITEKILNDFNKTFVIKNCYNKIKYLDINNKIDHYAIIDLIRSEIENFNSNSADLVSNSKSKLKSKIFKFLNDSRQNEKLLKLDYAIRLYSNLLKTSNSFKDVLWLQLDLDSKFEYDLRMNYFYQLNDVNTKIDCDSLISKLFVGEYITIRTNINLNYGYTIPISIDSNNLVYSRFQNVYDNTYNSFRLVIYPKYCFAEGNRFKIVDIIKRSETFREAFNLFYFLTENFENCTIYEFNQTICTEFMVLSECDKLYYFKHIPYIQILKGNFNTKEKKQENIKVLYNNKIVFFISSIGYDSFKYIKPLLIGLDALNIFKYSYIGSPYDIIGHSIDIVFIKVDIFEDLKYNLFSLKSLYTLLTRVKKIIYFVK